MIFKSRVKPMLQSSLKVILVLTLLLFITGNGFANLSLTYDSNHIFNSSIITEAQSSWFSTNGDYYFTSSFQNDRIYRYAVATPWDITTMTYDSNFYIGNQNTAMKQLFFDSTGTKLFMVGISGANDKVYSYTLSTPWDITTAVYVSEYYVGSNNNDPEDVFFKSDGTKMYILGPGSPMQGIIQYTLSTPWDITTATYDKNAKARNNTVLSFYFYSSGKYILISEYATATVGLYYLATPWDISTMIYDSNVSLSVNTKGLFVNEDTSSFYGVRSGSNTLMKYNINELVSPVTTFSSSQIVGTTDQNITLSCTNNSSGCKAINYNINNNKK
jgi:hypothetical protein